MSAYEKVLEGVCSQHNIPTTICCLLEQFCDPYNIVEKKRKLHKQLFDGFWQWMRHHPLLRDVFEDYRQEDYPTDLNEDEFQFWCLLEAIKKKKLWDSKRLHDGTVRMPPSWIRR